MASAPSDPPPVIGRVDRQGRLVAADPQLERLQVEAGSKLGAAIALPQLSDLAKTADRLQVPVSRRVLAAGDREDVEMWVVATPEDEQVALSIERWIVRAPRGPRLVSPSPEPATEAATGARWAVDSSLGVISIAPKLAEALGTTAEAAVGEPLTRLLRLEEGKDGAMPIMAGVTARKSFSGQRVVSRATGRQLLIDADVVLAPNGDFAGFTGVARDIEESGPERPAAGAAGVDSFLRTPIDRIIETAGRIAERADGPLRNEYATYAGDISAAAHHLLSVVRSMARERHTGVATVDLAELASEAMGMIEPAAAEKSIAMAIEAAGPALARGDSRSVTQILVNLVGNAVRYSPERSAVQVSFEDMDGSAVVHVTDTGPGIDPADQERIFERYEQASESDVGTGLGLAIARRLARSMGGDVLLKSEPGVGSRFSLVLPAA